MLIYDKAYTEVKNKYILPLADYKVTYSSLKNNSMKDIIVSKFISVEEKSDKELLFSFEQDILIKGLLGDIQLFYLRYLIQNRDMKKINGISLSPNWNIVTYYYEAFFAASLLLRIMFRGNIFLDATIKKNLETLVGHNLGYAISIESNQFYEIIQKDDMEYALKLKKSNSNTHELVWEKMDLVIDELMLLSRDKSDEKSILMALKKINNQLSRTYPSQLRNKVNYQPRYGLEAIERKLYSVNSNMFWVEFLLKNDSVSWLDDNAVVNAFFCYSEYIKLFCTNIITEYFQIKGNMNGVLKKFNEYTGETMLLENVVYNV